MSRPVVRQDERLPLKVLIIDESASERAELRRVLLADDMRTFELSSPIGATREALQHAVDAVVIDLGGSARAGARLVALLRNNRRLAQLSIVVLSGPDSGDDLAELRSTADAILQKERMHDDLASTLRRLHEEGRAVRPLEVALEA